MKPRFVTQVPFLPFFSMRMAKTLTREWDERPILSPRGIEQLGHYTLLHELHESALRIILYGTSIAAEIATRNETRGDLTRLLLLRLR